MKMALDRGPELRLAAETTESSSTANEAVVGEEVNHRVDENHQEKNRGSVPTPLAVGQ